MVNCRIMNFSETIYKREMQRNKLFICAAVAASVLSGEEENLREVLELLQLELGNGWSATAAVQFLTGAKCANVIQALSGEDAVYKPWLYAVHLAAKTFAATHNFGAVHIPDGIDFAELKRLLLESKDRPL